nr:hypothetical protein Itr_chr05CG23950 [Ipomoea trifida]
MQSLKRSKLYKLAPKCKVNARELRNQNRTIYGGIDHRWWMDEGMRWQPPPPPPSSAAGEDEEMAAQCSGGGRGHLRLMGKKWLKDDIDVETLPFRP